MSTERISRSQRSVHEDVLGCDLHAAMLPLLAVTAAFGDGAPRDRAAAHLHRIRDAYELDAVTRDRMQDALARHRGTVLEPFHCPNDLCGPMALACALLVRGGGSVHGRGGRSPHVRGGRMLVACNRARGVLSGVELDDSGGATLDRRELHRRMPDAEPHDPSHPPVPLAVNLEELATATIVPAPASIQPSSSGSNLVISLPPVVCRTASSRSKPSFHVGRGFTLPASGGDPIASPWIPRTAVEPPPGFLPVTGEIQRDPRATESHSVVIPLAPTLLLRLALLSGARRFVARIPCEASLGSARWLDHSTVVVGSIDVAGVRAAVLPWEGWSPTSPGWMPFVPFASGAPGSSRAHASAARDANGNPTEVSARGSSGDSSGGSSGGSSGDSSGGSSSAAASAMQASGAGIAPDCGPGSLDGLIDLLLDLAEAEVDAKPRARRAPSSNSRLRPVSVVGGALVLLKHTLDQERRARLESLTQT
jgi:hypothetical protein